MASLYFYAVEPASIDTSSVLDVEDIPDQYTYEFEKQIDEWKKPYTTPVTLRHTVLDLFPVLTQICGVNVSSASSIFDRNCNFEGYRVKMPDGTTKEVLNHDLDKYREVIEEKGYVYKKELISECDGWYPRDKTESLEGKVLKENDLIAAMLDMTKNEGEFYSFIGEALFALTKALAAVKEGKTVFAIVD